MENINFISGQSRVPFSNKVFILLLIVAPVINQYQFPGLTFIEYIAVFGVILIFSKNHVVERDHYLTYATYGFLATIFMTMFNALFFQNFNIEVLSFALRMAKYIVVVLGIGVAIKQFFDYEFGMRVYGFIVALTTLIFIGQYIIHLTTGQNIYALIPGLVLNYNGGINSSDLMASNVSSVLRGYYYRPSSIFIEPAHYAQYVIPWIALQLFNSEKLSFKKFLMIIIVTICALLTTSSLAIVGCIFVWIVFLFDYLRKGATDKQKLIVFPIIVIGLGYLVYYLSQNLGIMTSINVKLNSLSNLGEASSTTVRLFRGWIFYSKLNLLSQIFGVGYGNLTSYYSSAGIHTIYDSIVGNNLSYMSGITTVLNSFGIIGFLLFIRWIGSKLRFKSIQLKVLIGVLSIEMLTADCYDSASYWLIIAFIITISTIFRDAEKAN